MRGFASLLCPVCLVAGLVSCGSDRKAGDPATWVDDVCTTMIDLDRDISTARSRMDDQVSGEADPTVLMLSLEHFLGEVADIVVPAGDDVDLLGAPPIASGSQVGKDIKTLFNAVVDELATLEASVRQASSNTNDAEAQASALVEESGRLTDLDEEMGAILTDDRLLRASFEDASSCRRWVKQLDSQPVTTTTPLPPTTVPTTTVPATTVPVTTIPVTTVPATTVPVTTAPPTTAAPPPPTVPVTIDPYLAVRDQYRNAADEYNPKFDAVYTSFHDADGFILYKDAPTYCDQMATLEREWVDRMSVVTWPPDALDEAQARSAESDTLLYLLDQCAAAPGTRAGQDALLTALDIQDDAYYLAVDALRVAIGLPPINE